MSEQLTPERAIANLQQTSDPSARYYAAWWLGKFRVRDPAAIAALLAALTDEQARSPDGGFPLRRNAARALGKVGDRDAVPALIAALDCADYYVREAAAQALGELGGARAAERLLGLLAGGVEAATPVPGKPHLQQPYEAAIEALGDIGAVPAIASVEPFLQHPVEKVQCAAARALYQLTGEARYGQFLLQKLRSEQLTLRRSALMDLGAIGYLDAADAIASTPAENSLKLIALKGLLERQLRAGGDRETEAPLLALMDSLL